MEIRLNTVVGRKGGNGHSTFLSRFVRNMSCLSGIGPHSSDIPDMRLDENGQIDIDPLTYQTSHEKVFAGGDVLRVSVYFPDRSWNTQRFFPSQMDGAPPLR